MTPEEAIDAALLAFLDGAESRSTREGVALTVAAYERALLRCRACAGTGDLRAYGQLVHLHDDRFHPVQHPVPDGDTIPCVACGGQGVDLEQAAWLCVVDRYNHCSHDRRMDGHPSCGWAIHRREDPSSDNR